MVFSSLLFLFFFLPVFLVVYAALPGQFGKTKWRNGWLLIASALFYAWGAPRFLPVIAATSIIDYVLSRRIAALPDADPQRRTLLIVSIVLNLAVLGYFKYANFFLDQLNTVIDMAGGDVLSWHEIVLPIGISFLTFEKISYIVDVYRRVTPPAPSLQTYALFLGLFPHLIAGPIFRYHDVAEQLLERVHTTALVREGIWRFTLGLGKKVLIADPLSTIVGEIFGLRQSQLSPSLAWLGALAYSMQIYFDFSGYSDMAIGLGRMCGFRFVENFNAPYSAISITDFWRRWHISLSNWMREYLYIPLGGNRVSPRRRMLNLWIVFLLSGLWHGASWNFVVWGAYHGAFLAAERTAALAWTERLPVWSRRLWTFFIVMIGWIPFRAATLNEALQYLERMFFFGGSGGPVASPLWVDIVSHRGLSMLVIAVVIVAVPPVIPWESVRRRIRVGSSKEWISPVVQGCFASILLVLASLSLVNSHFHPFIYFRF